MRGRNACNFRFLSQFGHVKTFSHTLTHTVLAGPFKIEWIIIIITMVVLLFSIRIDGNRSKSFKNKHILLRSL